MSIMPRRDNWDVLRDADNHLGTEQLGSFHSASSESVAIVMTADVNSDNGRSQWMWFWLPNGDRIFGCFPQGDTFSETEIDAEYRP